VSPKFDMILGTFGGFHMSTWKPLIGSDSALLAGHV
jgi:hypothetical protein